MVETDPSSSSFTVPNWLRMILVVIAGLQALGSFSGLPVLFDGDAEVPGTTPGGLLIGAVILLRPFLSLAGFVFALKYDIARAVMGIAGVAVLDWLGYFPSFVIHWPDSSLFHFPGFFVFLLLPAGALIAIVLAWLRRRPNLAVALGIAPFVFNATLVIAFAISVAIHGF